MSSYRQNVVHVVEHFTRIRSRHTTSTYKTHHGVVGVSSATEMTMTLLRFSILAYKAPTTLLVVGRTLRYMTCTHAHSWQLLFLLYLINYCGSSIFLLIMYFRRFAVVAALFAAKAQAFR